MRIGELAAQTGASVRALRYYEEQGLLSAQRTSSAQRVYAADSVERVRLLRRLYNAGLTSKTIASLLPCVDTPSAAVTRETMDVMRREHARIGAQIIELITTRDDLAYLIDAVAAFHRDQLAADTATALATATA
jgi:DNA-binding transcriptional MerR regulator